jgi:hypothetical protein
MVKTIRAGFATLALSVTLTAICPSLLPAEDVAENVIEKAGVAAGVSVGNMVFLPAKAFSTSMGLFFGAVSFVLTGGDTEVAQQMWRNSIAEPYLITPELARKAIGRRPELSDREEPAKPDM